MPRLKPLTGQHGHLAIVALLEERGPQGQVLYRCRCVCGRMVVVRHGNLTRKDGAATKSCGCQRRIRPAATGQCKWCGKRCVGDYCTAKHQRTRERAMRDRECPVCGTIFRQDVRAKGAEKLYCSASCEYRVTNERTKIKAAITSVATAKARLTHE